MLAQALDTIPSNFWKYFCMALLVLLGVAVSVAIIYASTRKPDKTKLDDDPAINVRKAAKRYNHDAIDQRFIKIEGEVGANTAEIDQIWNTMRAEDAKLRDESTKAFMRVVKSLGRIEGRLNIPPEEQ